LSTATNSCDPSNDEENGSGSMSGTWGVWPYGNHVAISSMRHGLIMTDFFPIVVRADGSYEYPPQPE
jgi:hypothetical protein